jgi:hypothetical protein
VATLLLAAVGGTGRETSLKRGIKSEFPEFLDRMSRGWCVAKTYVALAADGLVAVVLGGKGLEGRLNDTTTETEDQVEGRLLWRLLVIQVIQVLRIRSLRSGYMVSTNLLDVVVGQSAAILELLAGEDETLLVWGNSLLVLDLALHIVDGVRGLDLKGDGLARQGLNEAVANPR